MPRGGPRLAAVLGALLLSLLASKVVWTAARAWTVPSVQLRRETLTRLASVCSLLLTGTKPEGVRAIGGSPLDGIEGFLGVDSGQLQSFSRDVFGGSGDKQYRAKLRFNTCWPVRVDSFTEITLGYQAGKDNRFPGESGFVQISKDIGVNTVDDLKPKRLLDIVFTSDGKIGENFNAKQATKVKTISGEAGQTYKVIGASFSKVGGRNGIEVPSRALVSFTVVAGDLYVFVVTCRDNTWDDQKSQDRIRAAVESFQVVLA